MKKRDDHVLPPEDTGDYVKAEFFAEQGGFFRKGKVSSVILTYNWRANRKSVIIDSAC